MGYTKDYSSKRLDLAQSETCSLVKLGWLGWTLAGGGVLVGKGCSHLDQSRLAL